MIFTFDVPPLANGQGLCHIVHIIIYIIYYYYIIYMHKLMKKLKIVVIWEIILQFPNIDGDDITLNTTFVLISRGSFLLSSVRVHPLVAEFEVVTSSLLACSG